MEKTNVFAKVIKTANVAEGLKALRPVRKFEKIEIAKFENGRLLVREDLKMIIMRNKTPNKQKIQALQQELYELEAQMKEIEPDDIESHKSTIRKFESQLKFELQQEFMDKNFYVQFNSISEVQRAIELMEDRQADRIDQALYAIWAPRLDIDLEEMEDYVDNRPLFPWVWNINPNLEKHTEALD